MLNWTKLVHFMNPINYLPIQNFVVKLISNIIEGLLLQMTLQYDLLFKILEIKSVEFHSIIFQMPIKNFYGICASVKTDLPSNGFVFSSSLSRKATT